MCYFLSNPLGVRAMKTVKVNSKTRIDDIKTLGLRLLGKDTLEEITFILGNYWEQRKSGLDTDTLFIEMVRLFKKKKLVKKMINDNREEAIKKMIEMDIKVILDRWCRQVRYILARSDNGDLVEQSITCESASVSIEEDSECKVVFKGKAYDCMVEGRRAIIGKLKNEYETVKVDKDTNLQSEYFTRRKLRIFNNFVGKTFWRTIGRSSSRTVELAEKDSLDKVDLYGQQIPIRRRRRKSVG